jgi:hypothetical protein
MTEYNYYYGVCRDVHGWRVRCAPLAATAVSSGELMARKVSKWPGKSPNTVALYVSYCVRVGSGISRHTLSDC